MGGQWRAAILTPNPVEFGREAAELEAGQGAAGRPTTPAAAAWSLPSHSPRPTPGAAHGCLHPRPPDARLPRVSAPRHHPCNNGAVAVARAPPLPVAQSRPEAAPVSFAAPRPVALALAAARPVALAPEAPVVPLPLTLTPAVVARCSRRGRGQSEPGPGAAPGAVATAAAFRPAAATTTTTSPGRRRGRGQAEAAP